MLPLEMTPVSRERVGFIETCYFLARISIMTLEYVYVGPGNKVGTRRRKFSAKQHLKV